MSSIKDSRDSLVSRETGKRLYVSPKSYQDQIRKPTIKGLETGQAPWSEFEKPYLEDSYEEMEYFMWNFPGFANHDYEMSWDNPSFPPAAALGGGGFYVFTCQTYGGFCPGASRTIGLSCSHPVTGVTLSWPGLHGADFQLNLLTATALEITASEDPGGDVEIDISMLTELGIPGSHNNIMIGSASDCESCETAETMEADPDNATTVVDSTNYTISVLYGVGPYSWSVQADDSPDVSLQNAVTSGRSNTLIVTDGCGTIIVTVVDSCGTSVDMVFLGDGVWSDCQSGGRGGSGCICSAPHSSNAEFGGANPYYFTNGGMRWRIRDLPLSDCYGNDFIAACCDPEPCGSTYECFPLFNDPSFCFDGVTPAVCITPCTGGCGVTIRQGQQAKLEFWECV